MFKTLSEETEAKWWDTTAQFHQNNVSNTALTEVQPVYNLTAKDSGPIVNNMLLKVTRYVFDCGITPALSLMGLTANVINMAVFRRQGLQDKMNLCLFALAFVDFMSLVPMLLYSIYCPAAFLPDLVSLQVITWNIVRFTVHSRYAFMYSSGMLTAIIATERCICVLWPLRSASMFNTKTMGWMILGITVVLIILCLPYALKHVVRVKTDSTGAVRVVLDDTDLYINHKFAFQVVRDGVLPAISFITFFLLSFVTAVTVRKLKTAMDWREKSSSSGMDKRQMTLVNILIAVSCVYIVCNVPTLSLAMVKFLVADFSTIGKYSDVFYVTHRIAFGFLMLNSSVNIFIYYKQSSRFRKELHTRVCCFKDQNI